MNTKIIVGFLLIATQFVLAQDNSEISEELEQGKAYNQALYSYLRQHTSSKIQLIGYSTYLGDEDKDIKAIKKALDKSISLESDKETLFLADNLCHTNKKLETWCHKKQIHHIHQQVDPENIMTYVNALHDKDDEQKVIEWLDLVANQSSYSNSFLFELSLVLSEQISVFNHDNPSLLLQNKESESELLTEIKSLRLIEKGLFTNNFLKDSEEAMPYIIATGIMMAQSLSLRNYTLFCQDSQYHEQCQHIAETLKTDNTFIGQIIADTISRKITGIMEPNRFASKSYQKATCYSQSIEMLFTQIANPIHAKQYLIDAIEYDEGQAIENLAFKVYETVRAHGFNPDFNPHDC
jgi:hypothetical protein